MVQKSEDVDADCHYDYDCDGDAIFPRVFLQVHETLVQSLQYASEYGISVFRHVT